MCTPPLSSVDYQNEKNWISGRTAHGSHAARGQTAVQTNFWCLRRVLWSGSHPTSSPSMIVKTVAAVRFNP